MPRRGGQGREEAGPDWRQIIYAFLHGGVSNRTALCFYLCSARSSRVTRRERKTAKPWGERRRP